MKKTIEEKESTGERVFMTYWNMYGYEEFAPMREFRFFKGRKWAFDFCWVIPANMSWSHYTIMLAVEIEGGVYSSGRHTRGAGFEADCEKYNAAIMEGWRVLRYTPGMLTAKPQECIYQIITLLTGER